MPEQAQIPTRKITAIIYPAPQKPEPAVQIKSIHISAANRPSDFAFQLGRDAFVGIDNQHPLMLPANIFQSPVFLPWEFPIPTELHDSSSRFLGNRLRGICARRIDYHDFFCERDTGKTVAQVRRFILDRDKHRQGHPRAGFPITMLQGLTSFIATALAPTMAPSPIVTPGPTNASAQIHASEPIVIDGRSNGKSALV